MCGIAGFVDFQHSSNLEILKGMTDALAHRGPDDHQEQVYAEPSALVGFGHRRLSIIDLSTLGRQPMTTVDGNWTIVFNGEIYNYSEIRAVLIQEGIPFRSHSDTEVILYAFHLWGPACISRFIGMFSFALLDRRKQQLYLVRDRAGVKPLYYYHKNGLLLFASELKAFHKHPGFNKKLNLPAFQLYLQYGYIPAPNTIFEDTCKVPPGHYLQLDLNTGSEKTVCYWDVYRFYNQPALDITEAEALQRTREILLSACEYRMVADVPVGVFLSGGYDSSLVTALLQTNRTERLKTFTIGFENAALDEAPYAKSIAEYLGTDHTEYYCTTAEAQAIIPSLSYYFDEPFADSSAIPTMLVSQMARKEVTVALSADAGDETFAGYRVYDDIMKMADTAGKVPQWLRHAMMPLVGKVAPVAAGLSDSWSRRTQKMQTLLEGNQFRQMRSILAQTFRQKELQQLLTAPLLDAKQWNEQFSLKKAFYHPLQDVLAADYQTYLVDDVLTKVDRATMSTSLEGREPLLDHRLIEWSAQLPVHFKYRPGEKKYLLRKIAHELVPEHLLNRPKMGFSIPLADWLQTDLRPWAEELLQPSTIQQQGLLQATYVEQIKNNFFQGDKTSTQKLWTLLSFQMWWKEWME